MYIRRLFYLLLLFSFTSDALVDVQLDLAVIIHTRISPLVSPGNKKVLDALKGRVLPELARIFKLGQEKTRITVMKSEADVWSPYPDLNSTADEATYKQGIAKIQLSEKNPNLGRAFKAIREKVFTTRPGVVLIFARRDPGSLFCCSSGSDQERKLVRTEAGALQKDKPIWIIFIFEYDDGSMILESKIKLLIKEKNGLIKEKMESINGTTLKQIKAVIDQYLCSQSSSDCFCSDADRSKCVLMSWTPLIRIHSGECPKTTPQQPSDCTIIQCEQMCEKHWPWSSTKPDCEKSACGVSVARNGTYAWKELQYCQATYECPCSTTTEMTTSIATTADSTSIQITTTSDGTSVSTTTTPDPDTVETTQIRSWLYAAIALVTIAIVLAIGTVSFVVLKKKRKSQMAKFLFAHSFSLQVKEESNIMQSELLTLNQLLAHRMPRLRHRKVNHDGFRGKNYNKFHQVPRNKELYDLQITNHDQRCQVKKVDQLHQVECNRTVKRNGPQELHQVQRSRNRSDQVN